MSVEITTHKTRDEAIAYAMQDAVDGTEVLIHDAHCASKDIEAACNCSPEVHVVKRGVA